MAEKIDPFKLSVLKADYRRKQWCLSRIIDTGCPADINEACEDLNKFEASVTEQYGKRVLNELVKALLR